MQQFVRNVKLIESNYRILSFKFAINLSAAIKRTYFSFLKVVLSDKCVPGEITEDQGTFFSISAKN